MKRAVEVEVMPPCISKKRHHGSLLGLGDVVHLGSVNRKARDMALRQYTGAEAHFGALSTSRRGEEGRVRWPHFRPMREGIS